MTNLVLVTVDGEKWSLNEQRGRIVLINFWATWCLPCLTEIPLLVQISDKYKESGLEIVGISVDSENMQQINSFKENFQISYPLLLTVPGSLLSRQKAIPMTLLIDEKGFLAKKYIGAVKENIIERDIKELLRKKSR